MPIEEENVEHQLLFDGAGNEQFYDVYTTTMNWHCGATYFVRGGLTSATFFQNVLPYRSCGNPTILGGTHVAEQAFLPGLGDYDLPVWPEWIQMWSTPSQVHTSCLRVQFYSSERYPALPILRRKTKTPLQ